MNHPLRLARASLALALLLGCARAQTSSSTEIRNPDFESGARGQAPDGWRVPRISLDQGYTVALTETEPASGRLCVLIERLDAAAKPGEFGNILQSIDAVPLRGKRVRFRAAVRAEVSGPPNQAQLWMRVDRTPGQPGRPPQGFFDNMGNRPIRTRTWSHYEIIGDIDADADKLFLGCFLAGVGRAWLDQASLEVLGEAASGITEAPRAFTPQGLANVTAFVRLMGYVRYFHPSDEAAATDWEAFTIDGVRAVEGMSNANALAAKLTELFSPIAPTVQVSPADRAAKSEVAMPAEGRITRWKHIGLGTGGRGPSIYSSKRVTEALPAPASNPAFEQLTPLNAELGGDVVCTVPLAVLVDDHGTLPRAAAANAASATPPRPTQSTATPQDRATRLAAVALAWNVLEHSYPYFDIVQTDWSAELTAALQRAATDPDGLTFLGTLRRLIAALHDGHGNANYRDDPRRAFPPFRAEWIEEQLVLTDVPDASARNLGLVPGDTILSIDGRPTKEVLADAEAQISGASRQWIRFRATRDLFAGGRDSPLALVIEPVGSPGERKTIAVTRDAAPGQLMKRRGETLVEMEPGIFYLDLDRLTTEEFTAALPRLEKASGLVFDLRGYPSKLSPHAFFPHLSQTTLKSAQWHTPHVARPDHTAMNFIRGGEWTIPPKEPFLTAKRAFITDGRAISYAESCMGIVEHYKLGAIVGGATAGTNGNINTMTLPGGYSIVWTGMKVLKHDGSRHHGIGILPTIPVEPTRAGIAAGHDELLERAIQAVKAE